MVALQIEGIFKKNDDTTIILVSPFSNTFLHHTAVFKYDNLNPAAQFWKVLKCFRLRKTLNKISNIIMTELFNQVFDTNKGSLHRKD